MSAAYFIGAFVVTGVSLVCVYAGFQVMRGMVREHARERQLLINQILHISGRTWQEPPSVAAPPTLDELLDDSRYSFAPEQEPDEVY